MAGNKEDTSSFVKKLHETQEKDEKNRRSGGHKHPEERLPNHKH
ncbi:DUF4023 family protein [Paenibacillus thalictri]|uniref:DUF4023 domain-containing protein n=1 Tax=Paenibacillus thalictri TaxID=2527873 RepID=A0A4Q9DP30_9BACL|nr:DUF4023 family protein [Paenibacillus thalictri]TBL77821.1 DUF4023 domain-containing protein [Paenibacillus thalictri]